MGALDSQEECLASLDDNYSTAQGYIFNCLMAESAAYGHYLAGEALDAIYDTLLAIAYLRQSMSWITFQTSGNDYNADIIHYLANYAGVTWQSIVEAWVKDDFKGRFWTIGVIDRMRQIMWDEPFDLTWAARPEQEAVE